MRVVVAPDKFRGSLSARQVAHHVAIGLVRGSPSVDVVQVPVADGGEGTLDAAIAAGFRRVEATAAGPTGDLLTSAFAVRGRTAVIEMAAASGLGVLSGGPAPLVATSHGTGDLIRAALDHHCTEIILGVGGSACTDGGAGLLTALGARLMDAQDDPITAGGAALRSIARVDLAGLDRRLKVTRIVLASDVDNPLLGETGAAATYGPQKGASRQDIAVLESGLARWVGALEDEVGAVARDTASAAGAGAAGGVGYVALLLLRAECQPGIEAVLDLVGFEGRLAGADLVITGEGSIDRQTLRGKAPAGVALTARRAGIPVVAVAGRCSLDDVELSRVGLDAAYTLTDLEPDVERCMTNAAPLLELVGERIALERQ